MNKKLVFVTWHYKKVWLSVDYFLFGIHRFILININGNSCQKSWELIVRTFILQASCAPRLQFRRRPILDLKENVWEFAPFSTVQCTCYSTLNHKFKSLMHFGQVMFPHESNSLYWRVLSFAWMTIFPTTSPLYSSSIQRVSEIFFVLGPDSIIAIDVAPPR